MGNTTISKFDKEYFFLSNFYPCKVHYQGQTYKSSEAAYQAQKTPNPKLRREFETLSSREAKKRGRMLELRKDWEEVKDNIMYEICYSKFVNNPIIARKLIATKDAELVEGNTWFDTYWGVCNNVGLNKLGQILMKVREEMRKIYE